MPGVLVGIAKHNHFVMAPIVLQMRHPHLNSLAKKVRKPICVPARKQVIHPIVMGHIITKKGGQLTAFFFSYLFLLF